jgi:carbonic anhydrase
MLGRNDFRSDLGHLFVTRVAGNVVTPEIIASLEYGAAVLGTEALLVLGHAGCGAVKATIQARKYLGRSARSFLIFSLL